ncbi:unnamed protein product [Pleuronectes platessa]|uniref:Uncharacterized protein n=1 Tax=Pleuronectes platessa TaxID=8262 RepID=A0A9N7W4Z3_PLEPL|nr:unnamed protein product [Pleuronectes platessa]
MCLLRCAPFPAVRPSPGGRPGFGPPLLSAPGALRRFGFLSWPLSYQAHLSPLLSPLTPIRPLTTFDYLPILTIRTYPTISPCTQTPAHTDPYPTHGQDSLRPLSLASFVVLPDLSQP